MADTFKIVEATSENAEANIKVDGSTVTAQLDDYDGSVPVIAIRVTLKDRKKAAGKWTDANVGPAKAYHLVGNKTIKTVPVDSSRLFIGDKSPNWDVPPLELKPYNPKPPKTNPPKVPNPPVTVPPNPLKTNPPKVQNPSATVPRTGVPPKSEPPKKPEQFKPASSKSVQPRSVSSKPASKAASTASKHLPKTEDAINPWMWVGIGVLGVGGIVGALGTRKRRED